MDHDKLSKIEHWNQHIIQIFWAILFLTLLGQIIVLSLGMLYTHDFEPKYFFYNMALPSGIMLLIIVATTRLSQRMKVHHDVLFITAAFLISYDILAFINPKFHGVQIVLILPLLVAMFYFKKNEMIFTCFATIFFYALLLVVVPERQANTSVYELIIIILMLIGTTIVGIGIINRGNELISNLEKSLKSEQQLLIDNIIMDRVSKIDALTELYNHKTFHEYIEKLVEQSEHNGLRLQLALIDIDDFKKVNDTYGHWAGDEVLKTVAREILRHMTPNDFVARYGGEEFAAIFTDKPVQDTIAILENIRSSIAGRPYQELMGECVTISIGLHDYVKGDGKEKLFKQADSALYVAKKRGKNKTVTN